MIRISSLMSPEGNRISSGVYPTQVAEWGRARRGRAAADLRQVRRGQDELAKRRISEALRED